MSTFTVEFDWYNPLNPKCRNCEFWSGERMQYDKECKNKKFRGNKWRDHNSKACVQFEEKQIPKEPVEDKQEPAFYCEGYSKYEAGYVVKNKIQGDLKVAVFITEIEATDYVKYRNRLLEKYNTTDVGVDRDG